MRVQPAHPELTFNYLSGLPTHDLEDRLSKLPPHSAAYYLAVSQDGAGQSFPSAGVSRPDCPGGQRTDLLLGGFPIGHGILGGSLYRQEEAIDRIGELAVRVLRGEAADSIPVATLNLNTNMVDWRQLRRWRIDVARLPAGTLVRFREPTLWDRCETHIFVTVLLLVTRPS